MSMPFAHILVTGGAGFIGNAFVRHLLETDPAVRVTNLDLLTYAGNPDNLADVADNPRYRFIQGDIRDAGLVEGLFADTTHGEISACVNIAAQTHVDRSISGPDVFISTNIVGTHVLLDAARKAGLRKFVQVSTDEVYGSLGPTGRFTEASPLAPSSPYSASKAAADLIAASYHATYGLPVCITRCSNNYGPRQYPEKLIPLFILNALEDRPVPVYGDGLNVRDWIHVADHNRALASVLAAGEPGEVYNIGGGNERTNLEITRLILDLLDKPDSLIRFVADRPGHDRRYAIDSGKIQKELGWHATQDFADGLAETVRWYRANPAWVAGVRRREGGLVSAPGA